MPEAVPTRDPVRPGVLPWVTRRRAVLRGAALAALPGAVPWLSGCDRGSGSSNPGPDGIGAGAVRTLTRPVSRTVVPLRGAPDLDAVVAGMRAFGQHLHRVAATVDANWTVSPLSVTVAAGMLRAGARGRTARQIDEVFGFPPGSAAAGSPHPALNALTADLVTTAPVPRGPAPSPSASPTDAGTGPPPIVAVANGLFIQRTFASAVGTGFRRLLAAQYGAAAQLVDFAGGGGEAVLNAWADRQTRGRIRRVFDSLDPSTLLVLANAVYLKTTWEQQFDAGRTRPGAFTTAAGRTVRHPLMHQVLEGVEYAEGGGWQRVTLRYVGDELSMRIVLPGTVLRDRASLTALLPVATRPAPARALGDGWVDLTLPRWDTGTAVDLSTVLPPLGMTDAFNESAADFRAIAPGLHVSQGVHRANVTVDELGTEAAAVTAAAMAASARRGKPTPMRVDRPFVWAVVHEPTGTPVFTGHVVDPTRAA